MLVQAMIESPDKGSGIGLSISTRIIKEYGGTLFIDHSDPNTKFVIQLPK